MNGTTLKTNGFALKESAPVAISSGVLTVDSIYTVMAAETGTTDDVDTITPDFTTLSINGTDYAPIIAVTADTGDTITLKYGITGDKNLNLPNDSDIVVTDDELYWLIYNTNTGLWRTFMSVAEAELTNVDSIQFNTSYSPGAHSTGLFYWDSANHTASIDLVGSDVSLQLGQEMHVYVTNDSGGDIDNGEIVYVSGASGGLPTIALAQADAAATATVLGVATEDIINTNSGYITTSGLVRGLNTSSYGAGDLLWLSDSVPGAFIDTKPTEPSYQRRVAIVLTSDISDGIVYVCIRNDITLNDLSDTTNDLLDIGNGMCLDSPAVTVTSNGTVITCSVEKSGGGDITVKFNDAVYEWDCTPADTVTLTAGTDSSPQINYVYLLESTSTLTANTSDWPATEYVPVASVLCQSAASLQTDGAYKMHAWTDHAKSASDNMGHMAHLNFWIRSQHATWQSDVALTAPGIGAGVFDIATTAGVVLQLHDHTMPARTTVASANPVWIVNDSVTAYDRVANLANTVTDADGNTLTNKHYNIVVWGVVNEAEADCKLMVNLPSGSYNTSALAIADADKTANYNIPAEFKGVGFLIGRLTVQNAGGAGGTFTLHQNEDLRGQFPSTFAGGTAATVTTFADNAFSVYDDGDPTKLLAFQCSGITPGNTRTVTVVDADGTMALIDAVQTLTNKTLTTPTMGDFTNATHDHEDPAGGGQITPANAFDAAVPITLGGTGQTAQTDAFDALSPTTTQGDIIYHDGSDNVRLAKGTASQVLTMNAGATAPEWAATSGSGIFDAYAVIIDQKAQNTAGGTFTAGAWRTRDLTTEQTDDDNIVSLSSNQITLAAGTYFIRASAPAYRSDVHQTRLYNVSDTAEILAGTSESAPTSGATSNRSFVIGQFTIADTKTIELQHYCTNTQATNGFGVANNLTDEVYSSVEIWREA
jgi:hypothetical protein